MYTSGEMRWTPPRKPSNIPGVQNATTQPNQCPQAGIGLAPSNPFESRSVRKRDVGTSEDCLFLKFVLHLIHIQRPSHRYASVHVPSGIDEGAKLPVVFWIHGGG